MPDEPVVPDLAGWRVETMPELPDTAFIAAVTDWVCEVLSRSTEKLDRDEKLPLYAEQGGGHVWLVDPAARTLEAYTLGESGRWREVRHYRAALANGKMLNKSSMAAPLGVSVPTITQWLSVLTRAAVAWLSVATVPCLRMATLILPRRHSGGNHPQVFFGMLRAWPGTG